MLERFLLLIVIFITALIPGILIKFRYNGEKINLNLFSSRGIELNSSRPSVIYFWSDYCAPCITQSIILKKLTGIYLNINFISLNAVKEKELAAGFNIKTVPSIALISKEKEMKFLNHGFTTEEQLKKELEKIC